jgi:hypothetical protein
MIIELTNDAQMHYQVERNTANLIRKCYLMQCQGKKLTAEKLYALCQLTWWSDKGNGYWETAKLPALWSLWNKKGAAPYLIDLGGLKQYGFPKSILNCVEKRTGFTNLYKAYRNSSKVWIKANFDRLAPLVHEAAKLKNNEQRIELAERVHELHGIPMANHENIKMNPANLLTPLIACLDSGLRFPIVNKNANVVELHRKLGITNSSPSEQFKTLIRLIGQHGIKDALMLDVQSGRLAKIKVQNVVGRAIAEIKNENKSLDAKDDSDIEVIVKTRTKKMIRLHNSMTNSLTKLCKNTGYKIFEGSEANKFDALIKDYDDKSKDLLIEVKSSIERSHLRLAVGQLFDYRRKLERRAITDLAVLLPKKPKKDDIDFLNDVGIHALWFINRNLMTIKGNLPSFF